MSLAVSYRLLTPLLLLGFVQVILTKRFVVKEASKICLLAEFSANFSVSFETTAKKQATVLFPLPEDAKESPKSNCSSMIAPLLVVSFGDGHSLSMNFSRSNVSYKMEELTLVLNMSNSALFPNSSKVGLFNMSRPLDISAKLNTTYTCKSDSTIYMENVNVTLNKVQWEVLPPADGFSKTKTECHADVTPSVPPTTPVTTLAPTTATPVIQNPTRGRYNVTNNNVTCLLAEMGLQINITQMTGNKIATKVFNIYPNLTHASGNCSKDHAFLQLTDKWTTLIFQFVVNATFNNFYLKGISISSSLVPSQGKGFQAENISLHYLQTSLGKSYMCQAEQVLQVTPNFSINAFELRVQPFKVENSKYGIAEECQMDKDDMLIPIIVGAALAGLVLIVLIAYLIGRKRSHAGYQTI
ncbi:lysosome-associated membrane glycoprotein 1a [Pristis pectinata]|uniref:lysosome-associated membrane glycoprotein 1a n=1 Tax=Pristis pectinata TaxID=685728 RepID=UPI00223DA4AE|nr:lysosome-associated membrane glycoprotein 1a [Pristis pectinata]